MIRSLLRGRIPGQVVIQYTDRCNAACPQCGMRRTEPFSRATLGLDTARRVIDAAAERGVKALSFTGGEPLLHLDDVVTLIDHAAAAGIPFIRTGTNGFLFMGSERPDFEQRIHLLAGRLARTRLSTFWISVDSAVAEVHEAMRGLPGVVRGMARALPIFHQYGLYPSANLGINRNTGGLPAEIPEDAEGCRLFFLQAFERFYQGVEALGFTIVNACYPMSGEPDQGAYRAASPDDVVRFSSTQRAAVYRALFETIPRFRHRLRIFSPRSSLHALIRQHQGEANAGYPCPGGRDFFFVDARRGDTFPCGYRGEDNLGKFWQLDTSRLDGAECRRCDWECFRDPAEMIGPLQDFLRRPWRVAQKCLREREALGLWLEDLRYYRACEFFNGRRPLDTARLARFCRDVPEAGNRGAAVAARV
jgi:MoaA/NifB/PqqE/SkfB family radical SAM enzyme